MANLDLTRYSITGTTEIVHNPSYDVLFCRGDQGGPDRLRKGQVSELGAVNVMTGVYTGRSPKDKYIVMDENSKDTVLVDQRRVQERQPPHDRGHLGYC